jgi:hypothetical protein
MACEHGGGLEVVVVEWVGIGGCYGVVVAGMVVVGGVEVG